MDSGQVEKDEERKWLRSEDMVFMEDENDEDLMSFTIYNAHKCIE